MNITSRNMLCFYQATFSFYREAPLENMEFGFKNKSYGKKDKFCWYIYLFVYLQQF